MLIKRISVINIPIAIRIDCIGGDNRGVRIFMFVRKKSIGLDHSPALNDAEKQYHNSNDEQNMDKSAHRICGDHAKHPEYECNDENSYKHKNFLKSN
jgi:hypothetical protein